MINKKTVLILCASLISLNAYCMNDDNDPLAEIYALGRRPNENPNLRVDEPLGLSPKDHDEAQRLGRMKSVVQWNADNYMKDPMSKKMGDALEDGVTVGVTKGIATVIAVGITTPVFMLAEKVWGKTTQGYAYFALSKEQKEAIRKSAELDRQLEEITARVQQQKIAMVMTEAEISMIEQEKKYKAAQEKLKEARAKKLAEEHAEFFAAQQEKLAQEKAHNSLAYEIAKSDYPGAAPAAA